MRAPKIGQTSHLANSLSYGQKMRFASSPKQVGRATCGPIGARPVSSASARPLADRQVAGPKLSRPGRPAHCCRASSRAGEQGEDCALCCPNTGSSALWANQNNWPLTVRSLTRSLAGRPSGRQLSARANQKHAMLSFVLDRFHFALKARPSGAQQTIPTTTMIIIWGGKKERIQEN